MRLGLDVRVVVKLGGMVMAWGVLLRVILVLIIRLTLMFSSVWPVPDSLTMPILFTIVSCICVA